MQQGNTTDSLLEDALDEPSFIQEYKKPIKRARITLFVLAGIQLLAIYIYFTRGYTVSELFYVLLLNPIFAVTYGGLAFWMKRKPYTAIITALIVFTAPYLYNCILYPDGWRDFLLIRILIYIFLIKALKPSQQLQIWLDNIPK